MPGKHSTAHVDGWQTMCNAHNWWFVITGWPTTIKVSLTVGDRKPINTRFLGSTKVWLTLNGISISSAYVFTQLTHMPNRQTNTHKHTNHASFHIHMWQTAAPMHCVTAINPNNWSSSNTSSCSVLKESVFHFVLYSSSCELLLWAISPPFPWTITFMQMTLSSALLSFHTTKFDSPSKCSFSSMTKNLLTLYFSTRRTKFWFIALTSNLPEYTTLLSAQILLSSYYYTLLYASLPQCKTFCTTATSTVLNIYS